MRNVVKYYFVKCVAKEEVWDEYDKTQLWDIRYVNLLRDEAGRYFYEIYDKIACNTVDYDGGYICLTTVSDSDEVTAENWRDFETEQERNSHKCEIYDDVGDWALEIPEDALGECIYSAAPEVIIAEGVTAIGYGLFNEWIEMKHIRLPQSLSEIRGCELIGCAFDDCLGLKNIYIPANVSYIYENTFKYCISLTYIEVDPDNKHYCSIDGALYKADRKTLVWKPESDPRRVENVFGGIPRIKMHPEVLTDAPVEIADSAYKWCEFDKVCLANGIQKIGEFAFVCNQHLYDVHIPDSVEEIGKSAFYGCRDLTRIHLPEKLISLEADTFCKCESLTAITIPGNVNHIDHAFRECYSLARINVDPNNAFYCSLDGILYSKDMKTLIYCPAERGINVSVPSGVLEIADYAFDDCCYLKSVSIPASVARIGECAFRCPSLKDIYYEGSEEQWNKISIDQMDHDYDDDYFDELEQLKVCPNEIDYLDYEERELYTYSHSDEWVYVKPGNLYLTEGRVHFCSAILLQREKEF